MLQNMRESFTGKFAFALLVLIGLSFVFVGLNYSFIGSTNAAKVDGEEILAGAFEQRYREAVRREPQLALVDGQFRVDIRRMLLDGMIQGQLIRNYLDDNGYRISDEQLTSNIQEMPQFQVGGRFDMDAYRSFLLTNIGQTPEEWEPVRRNELREQQLQLSLIATAIVTPAEYRRYLNLIAEQRVVTVATIDQFAIADELIVTDDMIQAYYNENQAIFMDEESADVDYIRISRSTIAAGIDPSEDELVEWHSNNPELYQEDEQRRARHILILAGDDGEALAQQALERVQAGEAFETVAAEMSADTGTAADGGDLGSMTEDQYLEGLGEAVFDMAEGEVRGPVETIFGFHIVRLDEIAEQRDLTLEQARDDVVADVRASQAFEIYRQYEDDLTEALFSSSEIREIGESLGEPVQTAAGFTRQGGGPFGANQAAIDAIFEEIVLTGGQISEVIELDADSMAIFSVAEFYPASPKPMADVRGEIDNNLRAVQAETILANRAEAALAAVADGTDFGVAAENVDMTVTEPQLWTRGDPTVDENLISAVFDSGKPEEGATITGTARMTDGSIAIFSLAAVLPGRPESIPLAQRDEGKLALAQQSGSNDLRAFVESLYNDADIAINEDVLAAQDVIQ